MPYEAVIGLEIHVQIKPRTKMFTAAPYRYGAAPNTLTDAVVLGLPGTLPVLNYAAIEKCAKLAQTMTFLFSEQKEAPSATLPL